MRPTDLTLSGKKPVAFHDTYISYEEMKHFPAMLILVELESTHTQEHLLNRVHIGP